MNRWAGFLIFLFLFASSAWAMGRRPDPDAVEPVRAVSRPITLQEAYAFALRRSELVAIQKEEIARTRAQWLEATGEAIGDVDFEITDFRQDKQSGGSSAAGSSVGSTLTATERRERKFVFSQPLFQGFRSLGALLGAGSLTRQRTEEYQRSKELLFLDVVEAFFTMRNRVKDVETLEGIQQLLDERISDLQDRERIGRSRTSEVSTTQARLWRIDAGLADIRGQLAVARARLQFLLGLKTDDFELQEEPVPDHTESFDAEEMAEEKSEVKAAYQAMKVARQAILVQQSDLWPHIRLDANHYEKREGFQSDIDWDMLFTINVPIFRGGTNAAKTKEAISNWKEAKLAYSLTKRTAELEIKEAHQNWMSSVEQSRALESAVKASEENYRLQQEDYARALVNNLDVLEALELLFESRRDSNAAFYQMKENYWRYQIAIGQYPFAAETVNPESVETTTA